MQARDFGRVGVLMGGSSAERDISLLGGKAVLQSLLDSGVEAVAIDAGSDLVEKLQGERIDRAFNMLHGRKGEDGKVQGLLEFMGIPYTGSGVLASALALDKIRCKRLWQALNINTPDFIELRADTDWDSAMECLGDSFVKPVKEGSSLGIARAESGAQLEEAFHAARQFDDAVIAERWIKGPEYTIGILGERALPLIELEAADGFYDFEAKYESAQTRYICPARLAHEEARRLEEMAWDGYRSVGCQGWGRVDAMADEEGRFWLLEVNTVPGMTSHSLVPKAARQAGIGFDQLVLEVLASSDADRTRD